MGAFGAHGLRQVLSSEMLAIYEKSVFYHCLHAIAIILTALLAVSFNLSTRFCSTVAAGFTAGIFFFSGSLYALTISGQRWLGAVTPIGGTVWILCWIVLGLGVWRKGR